MNKKIVSDWAKKHFLHWFVETHQFQTDGPRQILLQLAETEHLLSQIHIVINGSNLRPLLVISTEETGMPQALLKLEDTTITDLQAIRSQMALIRESPLYLTLYFTDRATSEPHQAVIEENSTLDPAKAQQFLIDFELSLLSEAVKHEMERAQLMRQIDQALEEKNKRKFRRLVKKLKSL